MKTILVLLCFAGIAIGDEPKSTQDKVDWMFLFPDEEPFSFETLYGSAAAFTTVKAPQRIEIYRIAPLDITEHPVDMKTILDYPILSGPIVPTDVSRAELVALLTAKDTFRDRPLCGREPGILLRASTNDTTVDLLFCFKCHDVVIASHAKPVDELSPREESQDIQVSMTVASTKKFLRVFQSLFPEDKELKSIKAE